MALTIVTGDRDAPRALHAAPSLIYEDIERE